MNARLRVVIAWIGLALGGAVVAAGDPPRTPQSPNPPWIPFPEIPAVLWYEDFDTGSSIATYGKVDTAPKMTEQKGELQNGRQEFPYRGDGNSFSLGVINLIGSVQKFSGGTLDLARTRLKAPGRNNPNALGFSFLCWAEDAGEIEVAFISKDGIHSVSKSIATAKTWLPVSLRIVECGGRDGHPKIEEVFSELKFTFRPRNNKEFQKVYIDNMLMTTGIPRPADLFPVAMAASGRVKDIEKSAGKDGFTYSQEKIRALYSSLKNVRQKKKPKSVLVLAPQRTSSTEFVDALISSAPKSKLSGFTFVSATAPDRSAVGGLDDMRMLLKYNLEKTECEYVLLALGPKDALMPGRPDESVSVLLDRTIEYGSIPIVSVSPPVGGLSAADRAKGLEFIKQVNGICTARGVPFVGESAADAAARTIKHVDVNLLGRK